jgi:hypothetical protein
MKYATMWAGPTLISCTRYQTTAAFAAFIEESRMKLVNANELHRKSGAPCEDNHR